MKTIYVVFQYDPEGQPEFRLNSGDGTYSQYNRRNRLFSSAKAARNYAAKISEGHVVKLTIPGQGDAELSPAADWEV
jgi:hypothetical protein